MDTDFGRSSSPRVHVIIYFSDTTLKALRKAGVKSTVFKDDGGYHRDKEIESKFILPEDFPLIKEVVKEPGLWHSIENRRVFRKLEAIESVEAMGSKQVKIKRLEVLSEAMIQAISKTPHRWVFFNDSEYGAFLPFFVTKIRFHPSEGTGDDYVPAHVDVDFEAMVRGESRSRSITLGTKDMPCTVDEALNKDSYYIETPKLFSEHEVEMIRYRAESPRMGEQYLARGQGQAADSESHWHRGEVFMDKDGEPSKVVMDDGVDQGKKDGFTSNHFWLKKHSNDDEDDGKGVVQLPVHPIVRVFNLGTHGFVDCHIGNVERYQYDASLINKLVLPADHKELIDALTSAASRRMSDIIKGKAQGVIILCSGLPGTGKTLSAEVYSEAIQRPLYMVQCSQLGTDSDKLEENLAGVLKRATRWRAILLIDEADVYIHERGADVHQNAIVGVFLRLLEYYNGILFLTTNRVTVVDDAILSRATAHVKYGVPKDDEERDRLWKVLCAQYKVDATPAFLKEVTRYFPKISGRSIRQLIRLSRVMADRNKKEVTASDLRWAAKFHDFTELEEGD